MKIRRKLSIAGGHLGRNVSLAFAVGTLAWLWWAATRFDRDGEEWFQ